MKLCSFSLCTQVSSWHRPCWSMQSHLWRLDLKTRDLSHVSVVAPLSWIYPTHSPLHHPVCSNMAYISGVHPDLGFSLILRPLEVLFVRSITNHIICYITPLEQQARQQSHLTYSISHKSSMSQSNQASSPYEVIYHVTYTGATFPNAESCKICESTNLGMTCFSNSDKPSEYYCQGCMVQSVATANGYCRSQATSSTACPAATTTTAIAAPDMPEFSKDSTWTSQVFYNPKWHFILPWKDKCMVPSCGKPIRPSNKL